MSNGRGKTIGAGGSQKLLIFCGEPSRRGEGIERDGSRWGWGRAEEMITHIFYSFVEKNIYLVSLGERRYPRQSCILVIVEGTLSNTQRTSPNSWTNNNNSREYSCFQQIWNCKVHHCSSITYYMGR
jgi:hypothetical protein